MKFGKTWRKIRCNVCDKYIGYMQDSFIERDIGKKGLFNPFICECIECRKKDNE